MASNLVFVLFSSLAITAMGARKHRLDQNNLIANGDESCAAIGCGAYRPGAVCQCNNECTQYNSCCNDYSAVCAKGDGAPTQPAPAQHAVNHQGAASCKAKVKSKQPEDARVCDDFYNPSMGIGINMVNLWMGLPARLKDQTSVTITHHGKRTCPFGGAGSWGIILNVRPDAKQWTQFQVCEKANKSHTLAARCHDGYECDASFRKPVTTIGWDYNKFTREKNHIVEITGTPACKNKDNVVISRPSTYNEFNTLGLSKKSIVGIIVPKCLGEHRPLSGVCGALKQINLWKSWPIFKYDDSAGSLTLDHYKRCR